MGTINASIKNEYLFHPHWVAEILGRAAARKTSADDTADLDLAKGVAGAAAIISERFPADAYDMVIRTDRAKSMIEVNFLAANGAVFNPENAPELVGSINDTMKKAAEHMVGQCTGHGFQEGVIKVTIAGRVHQTGRRKTIEHVSHFHAPDKCMR